jgi:putative NADPH-quinone reductase
MSRALVVYFHPCEDSFVARLRRTAVSALEAGGYTVDVADLAADRFDPVLSEAEWSAHHHGLAGRPAVTDHAERLAAATTLVFVHPTWWGGQPAPVKGWIDRVLCEGVAYRLERGRMRPGLQHIRRLAVVTTHGSPQWINRLQGEPGRRAATAGLASLIHPQARVDWLAIYGLDRDDAPARERFVRRVQHTLSQPEGVPARRFGPVPSGR